MKISLTDDVLSMLNVEQKEALKTKLMSKEILKLFKDEQVVEFCESFLEHGLNVVLTAENTYMHRNTLNYRLKKIESKIGLNLKNFSDAFVFKMILEIYKLDTNKEEA